MMTLKLQHGMRELSREFPVGSTVRDVTRDATVRAALGLPENVQAVVNGRTLSPNDVLDGEDVVIFERQQASKA